MSYEDCGFLRLRLLTGPSCQRLRPAVDGLLRRWPDSAPVAAANTPDPSPCEPKRLAEVVYPKVDLGLTVVLIEKRRPDSVGKCPDWWSADSGRCVIDPMAVRENECVPIVC